MGPLLNQPTRPYPQVIIRTPYELARFAGAFRGAVNSVLEGSDWGWMGFSMA